MTFNYRTPVKELYALFTDAKPINYDWSEHEWTSAWDYLVADHCDQCGKIIVGCGETAHADNQYENWDGERMTETDCAGVAYLEGPMMNYYYPVDFSRVGGWVRAAAALVDLPLCPVEVGDTTGIALTGGGMDLTLEIVQAYMKLGYLPPTHFADLPLYSGHHLDARHKWLLAGMSRSLEITAENARSAKRRLADIRKRLKEGV